MGRNTNVNVKVALKESYVNVKVRGRDKLDMEKRLRSLNQAKHLQRKFGPPADNSLAFLRKCFNRMSEAKVYQLYESATRKDAGITNSFAYFIGAAKAQPEMK